MSRDIIPAMRLDSTSMKLELSSPGVIVAEGLSTANPRKAIAHQINHCPG